MMRIISIEILRYFILYIFLRFTGFPCFRILEWMDKNFRTPITSPATMTAGVSASAR